MTDEDYRRAVEKWDNPHARAVSYWFRTNYEGIMALLLVVVFVEVGLLSLFGVMHLDNAISNVLDVSDDRAEDLIVGSVALLVLAGIVVAQILDYLEYVDEFRGDV
jgi:NADH:ubiquinone oxidoreductase subunit 6 (subunit J)